MARKKSKQPPPLPPRDGLGASRARVPDGVSTSAFAFLSRIIAEQRHRHPEDNDAAVRRRFAAGEVVLRDRTPLRPDSELSAGTDIFFYRRPAPETPVPYEIATVYEDENILIVDKPPFLATMPRAAHITETVTVRLRRATGNEELTPAHRLDRMTSGLLLLTKRREIRGAYQEMFARREVYRRYEAVAAYDPSLQPGQWAHHIVKRHGELASTILADEPPNSFTNFLGASPLSAAENQDLRQRYGLEGDFARYALEPITGRTHQLRVQMLDNRVPILGDPVYPTPQPFGKEDFTAPMLLRCETIRFTDPITNTPHTHHSAG